MATDAGSTSGSTSAMAKAVRHTLEKTADVPVLSVAIRSALSNRSAVGANVAHTDATSDQRRRCAKARTTYLVRLRAEPGTDPIRALRAGLKVLLRRFGLRAVGVREER
jgi:hypothetical protein